MKWIYLWLLAGIVSAMTYTSEVQRQCDTAPMGKGVAFMALFPPLIVLPILGSPVNCTAIRANG